MPDFLPEIHEAGTLSTPVIAGWCEALKWIKSLDINKIRLHEEDLYKVCINLFKENDHIITYEMNDYAGNTLLFNVKNKSAAQISDSLNKKGICTRSGFHCSPLAHKSLKTGEGGAVRVSFSVFNSRNDVYELVDAINDIVKKK
jgi:selenocysteine lyase/cysteine desulfurase